MDTEELRIRIADLETRCAAMEAVLDSMPNAVNVAARAMAAFTVGSVTLRLLAALDIVPATTASKALDSNITLTEGQHMSSAAVAMIDEEILGGLAHIAQQKQTRGGDGP